MSPNDVKKCIRAGFKMSIPNLIFLEIKNGRLLVSSNQHPTGNNLIDKREALYMCECCDEVCGVCMYIHDFLMFIMLFYQHACAYVVTHD